MSKHIAHHDSTAVLDTVAKLFRVMNKSGVSLEDFVPPMQSVVKRKNLVEYIKLGYPKVNSNGTIDTTPTEHELARLILADDFITPEEIANARGLIYTDEQLEVLEKNLPTLEIIAWCHGNNFILIPNPPNAMSLLDVRDLKRELFCSKEGGWYADHSFAKNDKTEVATWLAIRKGIVPNSISKKWKEQLPLITDIERVPNAAEFSWALTTYKEVRDIYLMENVYARTSSINSDGTRVRLGVFDSDGLIVDNYWDDDRHSFLGVSVARKF